MEKTIRVYSSMLREGMEIAEDIFHSSGMLLVASGALVTKKVMYLLKQYDVLRVKIFAPTEVKKAPIIYSEQTAKIKASKEFLQFEKNVKEKVESVTQVFTDVIEKSLDIEPSALLQDVESVYEGIKSTGEIFEYLNVMRNSDDAKYTHCLNVSILCNIFGRWLDLPESELEVLVLAGLLHDIGKVKLPEELITKTEKLTDDEREDLKKHAIYGYRILDGQKKLDPRIKMVALLHHERCDGKGYPQKRKYDDIEYFARIVAIADVYEAMTAERKYRKKICPFEVVEMFEKEGLQKYDPDLILTFLEKIAQTQLNNVVKLNNGLHGEIVFINRNSLSQPMIKVDGKIMDMTEYPDLHIVEVL